jgi:hypothetical protein
MMRFLFSACSQTRMLLLVVSLLLASAFTACAQTPYANSAAAQAAALRFKARWLSASEERAQAHRRFSEQAVPIRKERIKAIVALEILAEDKKRAIEELLSGRFCSKCRRSASEIERATKQSFSLHLTDVKGQPVPATLEMINQKRQEYDVKIRKCYADIKALERRYTQLSWKSMVEDSKVNKARQEYETASLWALYLKHNDGAKIVAPRPLRAEDFGLDGNRRNSEYGVLRTYYENEDVQTFRPGTDYESHELGWDDAVKFRMHMGIDMTSRMLTPSKKGTPGSTRAAPLPFSSPVGGRAYVIKGSKTNTIQLDLDNGTSLQFLHASKLNFKPDAGKKWMTVKPGQILGLTGNKGAGVTHLHVQAGFYHVENPKKPWAKTWVYLDPSYAVLKKNNPHLEFAKAINSRITQEEEKKPKQSWQRPLPKMTHPVEAVESIFAKPGVSQRWTPADD